MTTLLPEQAETLRQLAELWGETPFVLIGANALAMQVDLEWRQTHDLDFVLSVALEDYPAGLDGLPGWQRRPRAGEHAWLSSTGVQVDVVPAGPALLQAGAITWPRSGYRMSLLGLRLAFDHHKLVEIGGRRSVRVATTPAVVVLKMVAFLDRPDREDDVSDIAQVLERYLDPIDDRRFTAPADYDDAGAFVLGADVGGIVAEPERRVVEEFLGRAKDESDRYRTHVLLVRNGPWLWREHPETVFDRLAAFELGLRHGLERR